MLSGFVWHILSFERGFPSISVERPSIAFCLAAELYMSSVAALPPSTSLWFVYTNFCLVIHLFICLVNMYRSQIGKLLLSLYLFFFWACCQWKVIKEFHLIWVSKLTWVCKRIFFKYQVYGGMAESSEFERPWREREMTSLRFRGCRFFQVGMILADIGNLWLYFLVVS